MGPNPQSPRGKIERFNKLTIGDTVHVNTFDGPTVIGTLDDCSDTHAFTLVPHDDAMGNWQLKIIHDPEGGPVGVFLDRHNEDGSHGVFHDRYNPSNKTYEVKDFALD